MQRQRRAPLPPKHTHTLTHTRTRSDDDYDDGAERYVCACGGSLPSYVYVCVCVYNRCRSIIRNALHAAEQDHLVVNTMLLSTGGLPVRQSNL